MYKIGSLSKWTWVENAMLRFGRFFQDIISPSKIMGTLCFSLNVMHAEAQQQHHNNNYNSENTTTGIIIGVTIISLACCAACYKIYCRNGPQNNDDDENQIGYRNAV